VEAVAVDEEARQEARQDLEHLRAELLGDANLEYF